MHELIKSASEFLPHGYCFLWNPWILWPYVSMHLLITGAFLIAFPWGLWPWLRKNGQSIPNVGAISLVAFTILCGLGHAFAAANVWLAAYSQETIWNALTFLGAMGFAITCRLGARSLQLERRHDGGAQ